MSSGERGIALVVVLWFVVAAAGMSLTFIRHGQADLMQTRETLDAVQARALVDAGVARAVVELARSVDRRSAPSLVEVALDGGRASVGIDPESGKIDLNAADAVLIGSLARVLEVPPERADAIGEAVVDWRDEGDLRQPRGAEDRDYEAAGRAYGTPDEPFRNVEDLRYVLPVDPAVFELLAPHLTVYTGEARPQGRLAAGPVRLAMEQRSGPKQKSDSLLGDEAGEGRPAQPAPGSPAVAASADRAPAAAGEVVQDAKRVYAMTVTATLAGGYRRAERVVVWITDGRDGPPYRMLDRSMIAIAPGRPA